MAFLIVVVENYYPRWLYKSRKLAGKLREGEHEPDTPYTIANSGVPEFGGWIGAGRGRFQNLLTVLKKAYVDPVGAFWLQIRKLSSG